MSIRNHQGATLIEVLLASIIAIAVVVTLSLAFPLASKNITQTRQKLEATQIASAQLVGFRSLPYSYIDPTPLSYFDTINNPTCDCASPTFDFSLLPSTSTQNGGTTLQVASCINYVSPAAGNIWNPQCPASGDTGYKIVRVRVVWNNGPRTESLIQESSITRF